MWVISVPLIVLVLIVVGLTVLVVKAGAIALRLTGLDDPRAQFQALSAVTGTGFTTRESELVMADPRRRRIVGFLMVFGNVIIVTLISLLVGSFTTLSRIVSEGLAERWPDLVVTVVVPVGGAIALYLVLRSRGLTQRWSRWVTDRLTRSLRIRQRPVSEVLALAEGHGVAEVLVDAASPCAGKNLADSHLREAGLLVLAIRRGEDVLPTPSAHERIRPGDRLVCYGELARMHAFTGAPPETPEPTEPPTQDA
ncbi:MAG: TrkA C-terminal domain-containing protein [Phycisphaerae bacterium]|nr:TrkA C-terminal domain-containing protein [Phycisphaerae bacterium]